MGRDNQRVKDKKILTLITAIDWSKTNFSTIPSNQRKYFEREIYAIVSIEKSKLPLLKQKFSKLKHIKEIKEDWKKRDYLKKFAEKFDKSIFEFVDYTTSFDKLIIEFDENLKDKTELVIVDDHIYNKFVSIFEEKNVLKEGKVRDPQLRRLCLIADNISNLFRRMRDLYRNASKRIEIAKKIIKR